MVKISNDHYPEKGGPVGARKPRRNYWGDIFEEDRYKEGESEFETGNYDYSDYDSEDDHDSYYNESSYD